MPNYESVGRTEIKKDQYCIDCDADPKVSDDHRIFYHQKGGQWLWEPKKIKFYQASPKMDGKPITYADLYRDLGGGRQKLPNACVLDFVLDKPGRIVSELTNVEKAKSCNTRRFFFFGTLFANKQDGELYVRYLNHDCCGVHGHYFWLGREVQIGDYAVLFLEG